METNSSLLAPRELAPGLHSLDQCSLAIKPLAAALQVAGPSAQCVQACRRDFRTNRVLHLAQGHKAKVTAADSASETFRLRALVGKEYGLETKGNVYNNRLDKVELEKLIDGASKEEFERSLILELAKNKPRSVKELGQIMEVPPDKVLRHIVALRQRNLLSMDHPEGFTPTYRTIVIGGEQ